MHDARRRAGAGPALLLPRAHVPNESGDRVVLGALEDGPWLIDGPTLRMQLNGVWMGADQRNASLAEVMSHATDPERQRATLERQKAVDKLFEDPPNGGGSDTPGRFLPKWPAATQLDPPTVSEVPGRWYQFRRLRERVRRFAIDFWEKFEL